MIIDPSTTHYPRGKCVIFTPLGGRHGDLSNTAPNYPLEVNRIWFQSPEGLYQAFKFPHQPNFQFLLGQMNSGPQAQTAAQGCQPAVTPDWESIRLHAMMYTIAARLAQHPSSFKAALLATGRLQIVQESHSEDFWSARPNRLVLTGGNIVGKILTETRNTLAAFRGETRIAIDDLTDHIPAHTLLVNRKPVPIPIPRADPGSDPT